MNSGRSETGGTMSASRKPALAWRCNSIAEGLVQAAREIGYDRPLVVRLEGTNVDLGRKILNEADLPIVTAGTLAEAAQAIVKAVGAARSGS